MAVARKPAGGKGPLKRPDALDAYAGRWVLVREDQVIADAATDTELVKALRGLDPDARRQTVMQYVPKPGRALMVGLG